MGEEEGAPSGGMGVQGRWRGHGCGCERGRMFLSALEEAGRRGQGAREMHGRPGED